MERLRHAGHRETLPRPFEEVGVFQGCLFQRIQQQTGLGSIQGISVAVLDDAHGIFADDISGEVTVMGGQPGVKASKRRRYDVMRVEKGQQALALQHRGALLRQPPCAEIFPDAPVAVAETTRRADRGKKPGAQDRPQLRGHGERRRFRKRDFSILRVGRGHRHSVAAGQDQGRECSAGGIQRCLQARLAFDLFFAVFKAQHIRGAPEEGLLGVRKRPRLGDAGNHLQRLRVGQEPAQSDAFEVLDDSDRGGFGAELAGQDGKDLVIVEGAQVHHRQFGLCVDLMDRGNGGCVAPVRHAARQHEPWVSQVTEPLKDEVDGVTVSLDAELVEGIDDHRRGVAKQSSRIQPGVVQLSCGAVDVARLLSQPAEQLGLAHACLAKNDERVCSGRQSGLLNGHRPISGLMPELSREGQLRHLLQKALWVRWFSGSC
mmetsp:Transcript_12870/g.30245  ORF Transcript_12870/g.30245 Transcript_12870/m.30245 type:complete len:431 (+) Transcript_12870:3328-4620(+)